MRARFSLWVYISDEKTGKTISQEATYPVLEMDELVAKDVFRATTGYLDRSLEAFYEEDDDGANN